MDGGKTRKRQALAEDMVVHFSTSIRDGKLLAGMKLPPEWALGRQFGVSRTVVREAMSQLKADGLVHSRRGSGVYIAAAQDRRSFKITDALTLDRFGLEQFLELRQTLETSTAQFAAERRDNADLAEIEQAHVQLIRAPVWETDGLEADTRFHQSIANAAHNPFFAELLLYLSTQLRESIRRARQETLDNDIRGIVVAEHTRIVDAIAARRPLAARQAMRDHLTNSRLRIDVRPGPGGNNQLAG